MWPLAGCAAIAALYVGPLYLWRRRPRNHPATVCGRMAATGAACGLAWLPLYWALCARLPAPGAGQDPLPVWRTLAALLGLRWRGLGGAAASAVGLTAALFAGPLALVAQDLAKGRRPDHARGVLAVRNYLVAPLTEEFAFRACMAPLLRAGGYSFAATVGLTPLLFGAAHLHHAYELVTFQGYPLRRAAATVGFQLAYSTLFGWYATFLFLRTGHLAAPALAHALCNFLGFPDLPRLARPPRAPAKLAALAGGVAAFGALLGPATRPDLFGNANEAVYELLLTQQ